jgi:DNA-binding NarL/FixJ family response regulator
MTRHALITVSIADGNHAYCQSLAQGLARCPGVVLFDKCHDLKSAETALSERPPRVLLAGDGLPGTQGWSWIEGLRRSKVISTQIIAVSDSEAVNDMQGAFRSGAVGYLMRNNPLPIVHQALHDVTSGGAPLAPRAARALVASYTTPAAPTGLLSALTDRESEVLNFLSRGLRYEQIAEQMQLSINTVHTHTKNVYKKLNVRSKTEAAMLWLRSMDERQIQQPVTA